MSLGFRILSAILLLSQLAILPFVSAQGEPIEDICILDKGTYNQYMTAAMEQRAAIVSHGPESQAAQVKKALMRSILNDDENCETPEPLQVQFEQFDAFCNNMLQGLVDSYQLALQNDNQERANTIQGFIGQAIEAETCDVVVGEKESAQASLVTAEATIPQIYEIPIGVDRDRNICNLSSGPAAGGFLSQIQNINNTSIPELALNILDSTVESLSATPSFLQTAEKALLKFAKGTFFQRKDTLQNATYDTVVLPGQAFELGSSIEDFVNGLGLLDLYNLIETHEETMVRVGNYGFSDPIKNVMTSLVETIIHLDREATGVINLTPESIFEGIELYHTTFTRDTAQGIFVFTSFEASSKQKGLELIIPATIEYETFTLRIADINAMPYTIEVDDKSGGKSQQDGRFVTDFVADILVGSGPQIKIAGVEFDAIHDQQDPSLMTDAQWAVGLEPYIVAGDYRILFNIDGNGKILNTETFVDIEIIGPAGCRPNTPKITLYREDELTNPEEPVRVDQRTFSLNNTQIDLAVLGGISWARDQIQQERKTTANARAASGLDSLIDTASIKHKGTERATLAPSGTSWRVLFPSGTPEPKPLLDYRGPVQTDYTLISTAASLSVNRFIRTFMSSGPTEVAYNYDDYFAPVSGTVITDLNLLAYCVDTVGPLEEVYYHPGESKTVTDNQSICQSYNGTLTAACTTTTRVEQDNKDVYTITNGLLEICEQLIRGGSFVDSGWVYDPIDASDPICTDSPTSTSNAACATETSRTDNYTDYFAPEANIPALTGLQYCVDSIGTMSTYFYYGTGDKMFTTDQQLCETIVGREQCQNSVLIPEDNISVYGGLSQGQDPYCLSFTQGGSEPEPEPDPVLGCTDPSANNYNASATQDDGTCTYPVSGCTDSSANNYNASATQDDGSCTYDPVPGCTDIEANNYNSGATVDDGSCRY